MRASLIRGSQGYTSEAPPPRLLFEALYSALGWLMRHRPSALDEILGDNAGETKKFMALIRTWLRLLFRTVFLAVLDWTAATIFFEQQGGALSLCVVVCRSAATAALLGTDVAEFTKAAMRIEGLSKLHADAGALLQAPRGTSRKLVGDGPLGDAAKRGANMPNKPPGGSEQFNVRWNGLAFYLSCLCCCILFI